MDFVAMGCACCCLTLEDVVNINDFLKDYFDHADVTLISCPCLIPIDTFNDSHEMLDDLLNQEPEKINELFGFKDYEYEEDDYEGLYQAIHHEKKYGVIALLNVPIVNERGTCSFGLCRVTWVYADNIEGILPKMAAAINKELSMDEANPKAQQ